MASTYTTIYGIEKISTGEQSGSWGTTENYNWDMISKKSLSVLQPVLFIQKHQEHQLMVQVTYKMANIVSLNIIVLPMLEIIQPLQLIPIVLLCIMWSKIV